MEQELFQYNEKQKAYFTKIDNMNFSIDYIPTDEENRYALQLAESYNKKIIEIAKFILNDKNFMSFFEEYDLTEKSLIERLNSPTIRIINKNEGTVSYCEHSLDDIHIISFEFIGNLDKFAYLSIDG